MSSSYEFNYMPYLAKSRKMYKDIPGEVFLYVIKDDIYVPIINWDINYVKRCVSFKLAFYEANSYMIVPKENIKGDVYITDKWGIEPLVYLVIK